MLKSFFKSNKLLMNKNLKRSKIRKSNNEKIMHSIFEKQKIFKNISIAVYLNMRTFD